MSNFVVRDTSTHCLRISNSCMSPHFINLIQLVPMVIPGHFRPSLYDTKWCQWYCKLSFIILSLATPLSLLPGYILNGRSPTRLLMKSSFRYWSAIDYLLIFWLNFPLLIFRFLTWLLFEHDSYQYQVNVWGPTRYSPSLC